LVFLDIYATWCGPCKSLKSTTFADSEVGAYYNETFINVALDGEKGEGLELAKKYGVTGYPTLLFINSDGIVVSSNAGYRNAKELIGLGKTVQNKRKL
jgi:thioredoxin 1